MGRAKQSVRDTSSGSNLQSLVRILRVVELLNKASALMKSHPAIDRAIVERLEQLQREMYLAATSLGKGSAKPLPTVVPSRWLDRDHTDPKITLESFLRTVYYPWILDEGLPLSLVRKLDRSLYLAIYKYYSQGGQFSSDIRLLTKKEITDRDLRKAGYVHGEPTSEQREVLRLYRAARRRFPLVKKRHA
jgi:hypothetical protein